MTRDFRHKRKKIPNKMNDRRMKKIVSRKTMKFYQVGTQTDRHLSIEHFQIKKVSSFPHDFCTKKEIVYWKFCDQMF